MFLRSKCFPVLPLAILLSLSLSSVSCSSSKKGNGAGGEGSELSDQDLALGQGGRFGDGNIPQAQVDGLFKDIQFDYDSSTLRSDQYEVLKENAQKLTNDPTLHAEVEGHCDRRGTNEYNLALGEERAKSVAGALAGLGVKPGQLSTVSYGEEIPIDPADTDEAYAKNRRAHFAVYRRNG